jgi:hypothetical protein
MKFGFDREEKNIISNLRRRYDCACAFVYFREERTLRVTGFTWTAQIKGRLARHFARGNTTQTTSISVSVDFSPLLTIQRQQTVYLQIPCKTFLTSRSNRSVEC